MRWWLIKARKNLGMTQQEVSRCTSIPQPLYSMYENGKICPKVKNAKLIAAVLDFDWNLFYDEPSVSFTHSNAN